MRNETEGSVHLRRRVFGARDFACCVGLDEGELHQQENHNKYSYLRSGLGAMKRRRILLGCKGEYRPNPEMFRLLRDFGTSIGTEGAPISGDPDPSGEGAKKLLEDYVDRVGSSPLCFHDVSVTFVAPALHSHLSKLRDMERLPDNWRYDWDEKRGFGNKKFLRKRTWTLGRLVSFKVMVNTTDTIEVVVENSEKPFTFDDDGMIELLEVLLSARQEVIGDLGDTIDLPPGRRWVIVRWQRNTDDPMENDGQVFNITWQDAFKVAHRAYNKKALGSDGDGRHIRVETTESLHEPWQMVFDRVLEATQKVDPALYQLTSVLHTFIEEIDSHLPIPTPSLRDDPSLLKLLKSLEATQKGQQELIERLTELAQRDRGRHPDPYQADNERIRGRRPAGVS